MDSEFTFLLVGITSLITIVLAIFGASWLNEQNAKKLIDVLKDELKTEIHRLDQRIENAESRFDQRFSSIEQRLEKIERHLKDNN